MSAKSFSQKTLNNAFYSFLGYTWPIVFSVFITPVVVHKLGIQDFGVYVLINTLTGFLLSADLGFGIALMKYVSEYSAKKDFVSLQELVDSTNLVVLFFSVSGFLVFAVAGKFFLPIFHIPQESQKHIAVVFILGGIIFFLNAISIMYINFLQALQRYDLSVKYSLMQLTASNLLILAAVLFGYKLKVILLVNILTAIPLVIFYMKSFHKILPEINFKFRWHGGQIKKNLRFGIIAFINNYSLNSLAQLDRLLIPIFFGAAQLTYYSLPGNVAEKINGILGSTTGVLFPATSSLKSEEDRPLLRRLYVKAFRNVTVLAAALTVPIIFFSDKILLYWLGADFEKKGSLVLVILALTYFMLGVYGVLSNFLLGLGWVKFLMKASLSMAVLNLVLLLILMPKYGILGAAIAYLAGVVPVGFVFYYVEKMFLKDSGLAVGYARLYGKLVLNSLVFFVIVKFCLRPLAVNLPSLILIGPLSVVLFLALYKVFGFFDAEDWVMYKQFSYKIFNKAGFFNRA